MKKVHTAIHALLASKHSEQKSNFPTNIKELLMHVGNRNSYHGFNNGKHFLTSIAARLLTLVVILISMAASSLAQTDLAAGTDWQQLDYNGSYQDYKIPDDFTGILNFGVYGADGGFAKPQLSGCQTGGGSGAFVLQSLVVGDGADEIPPGSVIRFIIGQSGESHSTNGGLTTGIRSGAGGGGTAVIAKINGQWTILSVAGGGGGGYASVSVGICDTESSGRSGNTNPNGDGSGGRGSDGAAGGTGGDGGGTTNTSDENDEVGGGGGAFEGGDGSAQFGGYYSGGHAGWPSGPESGEPKGGDGGDQYYDSNKNGGFGFGGGGAANHAGGGGGGYSGGGSGRRTGGGGGGSYIHPDYTDSYSISADDPSFDNKHGKVLYRLEWKCFVEIDNVTVVEPENCASQGATVTATLDRVLPCATDLSYDLYDITDPDDPRYVTLSNNGEFENVGYGEFAIVVGNVPFGPMDTATFVVNVSGDVTYPTAKCKDITVTLDETGTYVLQPEEVDDGSTDDCGIDTYFLLGEDGIGLSEQTLTCDQFGEPNFIVGMAVRDYSGQTSICTAKVTVLDGTPPSLVDNQNITVYLDANGEYALRQHNINALVAIDVCDPAVNLTYTMNLEAAQYSCADVGQTITEQLTVSDPSGNTSIGSFSVTVLDDILPTIVCQNVNIGLSTDGTATINHLDFIASASDNCMSEADILSGYSWDSSILPQNVDCSHIGVYDITLLTSPVGYESNLPPCAAQLTIRDVTAPVISCRDTTIYLDQGNAPFTQETLPIESVFDACDSSEELSYTWKKTTSFTCADLGSDENFWIEVKDPSNNSSQCIFTVTVLDTTSIAVTCRDLNIELPANNDFTYTLRESEVFNGLTSLCNSLEDHAGTLAFSDDSDTFLDCDDVGSPQTVPLVYTPDDGSPSSSCASTISVREGLAPNITCPDGIIDLEATYEDCGAFYEYEYTAWDDECPEIEINLTEGLPSGSIFPIGWNDVRIEVQDKSGNATACSFVVRVAAPTAAPTLECPEDYTVLIPGEDCSMVIDTSAIFHQTCTVQNTQYLGPTMGTEFEVGNYTFGFRTRNTETNLSSQCSFTVTVNKANKKPVAICKDTTVVLTNGQIELDPSEFDGGSYDSCYELDYWVLFDGNFSTRIFNCSHLGENAFRLRVYNSIGAWSECETRVTFIPEDPECQDITVSLDEAGTAVISPEDVFIDDGICSSRTSIALDKTSFDCSDLGVKLVTLTRQSPDHAGQCTANVTVNNNAFPANCPSELLIKAKVLLEGPYNSSTGLMNDDLRSLDLIPTTEPYGNQGETVDRTVLAVSGSNAIVDWVLLQLRDENDHTEVLHERAALLQRDGDVVDLDGINPVSFNAAEEGRYFVAIKHRNHMGCISSSTFELSSTATFLDFTTTSVSVYGSNSRTELKSGVWGLYGADVDGSGNINASDRSMTWNDRNKTGYLNSDCNLDGATNANDRSAAWNNRNLGGTMPD